MHIFCLHYHANNNSTDLGFDQSKNHYFFRRSSSRRFQFVGNAEDKKSCWGETLWQLPRARCWLLGWHAASYKLYLCLINRLQYRCLLMAQMVKSDIKYVLYNCIYRLICTNYGQNMNKRK